MRTIKVIFTIAYFFSGVGLFAQSDSSHVNPAQQDTSITLLGIKYDTLTFIGVRAVNPLTVKDYRQILKSQFYSRNGKLEQQPLDMFFEEKTRKGFRRINATADEFMFSKRT